MQGGTTFHFVTDGIEEALQQARAAAGGKDIKIGGGVSTVRQYLQAGLVDEMHFAMAPVVLGRGEAMFEGSTFRRWASASPAMRPRTSRPTLCSRSDGLAGAGQCRA